MVSICTRYEEGFIEATLAEIGGPDHELEDAFAKLVADGLV